MKYSLIQPRNPALSITEQILVNRGIAANQVSHYLNTTQQDILNPLLLDNMVQGAQILLQHIQQNDRIMIQVDSDCDGYTSAAVLINYLNCLFPSFVQNNIYYRVHQNKEHGLILSTISSDVKLVIAPDASSNDYEVHKSLRSQGIDVLVLDHHHADMVSTDACVINNQLSNYPTKSLSGVGVVYKFCQYLDSIAQSDYANQFLDLVALGEIADVMDLRDFETRELITQGLANIKNPFLKTMINEQSYSLNKIGTSLTAFGVAFYIAPYVNAVTRIGSEKEKLTLFESMLDFRGYELIPSTKLGCKGQTETRVEQACRNCKNIKSRQTKARDASLDIIEHKIEQEHLLEHKILLLLMEEGSLHRELTGLIATKLADNYQIPTLVLIKTVQEGNVIRWDGSGRNFNNSPIEDLRLLLENTQVIEYAQGHASAFGFSILDNNVADFLDKIDNVLKDCEFSPTYNVDFIFDAKTLNANDILQIASLNRLWGQKVEEPYIVIKNIPVYANTLYLLKETTLKINLPNGMSSIKFGSSKEEYDTLYSELGCVTIDAIGKCSINTWGGVETPQFLITDYEIMGRTAYCF